MLLLLVAPGIFAVEPIVPHTEKVLRLAQVASDDGFDAVRTNNFYSSTISAVLHETLLSYDYLARPVRLVPRTTEAMPTLEDGGKTYVFHLQRGIRFTPDPVFKGAPRELTSYDYAYVIRRIMDPRNRSAAAGSIEGKIEGLDAWAERARSTGSVDYDAPIAGLQTPDRYTLRIRLKAPDSNFPFMLATAPFGAQAREAVQKYGDDYARHPVGTGPYQLASYVPRSKIVLIKNPEFRGFVWPGGDGVKPADRANLSASDQQLIAEMRGKIMPQIQRVEISVIEEAPALWLSFKRGTQDLMLLPESYAPSALDGEQLKPELQQQGIRLARQTVPDLVYTLLNYRDPVIGGGSLDKIALRRAIVMSYDVDEELRSVRQGQARRAEMLISPEVAGFDPGYRSSISYDPALANSLLDRFGYSRGFDGYRRMPDGSPLLLKMRTETGSRSRAFSEIWKRGLDKIGIRIEFIASAFADNLKAAKSCELMMWGVGSIASYPDADEFLSGLYGGNIGRDNTACYNSPVFDALYDQAKSLPAGAEKNRLYLEMNRQAEADTVWAISVNRIRSWLSGPRIQGFKPHPYTEGIWQYLDIAPVPGANSISH
ncbi:ABC transporter substrate-binding protein [Herbaspirillum lusitanum]|uniref:ABC transporter substrate-binding protein n=2 Tax=Herbaspirillum lusitanum TaxID=213312 RepID=A0ABW9A5B6_9BURK